MLVKLDRPSQLFIAYDMDDGRTHLSDTDLKYFVAGWGSAMGSAARTSSLFDFHPRSPIERSICREIYKEFDITKMMTCVKNNNSGKDQNYCPGNLGGPLLGSDNNDTGNYQTG